MPRIEVSEFEHIDIMQDGCGACETERIHLEVSVGRESVVVPLTTDDVQALILALGALLVKRVRPV